MNWPSDKEIEKAARTAAWRHQSRVLSIDARIEAAWDGITEAIANGQEGDLRDFGRTGINKAVVAFQHHHGMARSGEHNGANHAKYWHGSETQRNFADDLIDKIAIGQVMGAISPQYQNTLMAYIQAGQSIAGTATALGISYKNANQRICAARNAAKKLWFEPDPAPPQWHRSVAGKEISYLESRRNLRRWRTVQARADDQEAS